MYYVKLRFKADPLILHLFNSLKQEVLAEKPTAINDAAMQFAVSRLKDFLVITEIPQGLYALGPRYEKEINVREETKEKLRELAEKMGVTVSEAARRAILIAYLTRQHW